jgi:hypothetical protein
MKKILNDLKLRFQKSKLGIRPGVGIDRHSIRAEPGNVRDSQGRHNRHRERQRDRTAGQSDSRADSAAIYKEIKKLDYRELEYAQHDSKVCSAFIKLEERIIPT